MATQEPGQQTSLTALPRLEDLPKSGDGYDTEKVGLKITTFDELPPDARRGAIRRRYFDTREFGKSSAGHDFVDVLNDDEKRAVIEFLKTL